MNNTPLCTFPGCGNPEDATTLISRRKIHGGCAFGFCGIPECHPFQAPIESQERTNNDDINDHYADLAEAVETPSAPPEPRLTVDDARFWLQTTATAHDETNTGKQHLHFETAVNLIRIITLIESQVKEIERLSESNAVNAALAAGRYGVLQERNAEIARLSAIEQRVKECVRVISEMSDFDTANGVPDDGLLDEIAKYEALLSTETP